MIAAVLGPSSVLLSLSFPLGLLMVPILFLFVPQAIRRDKRTVIALVLLLLVVIAGPVFAHEHDPQAVSGVCNVCPAWLCWECLIYG